MKEKIKDMMSYTNKKGRKIGIEKCKRRCKRMKWEKYEAQPLVYMEIDIHLTVWNILCSQVPISHIYNLIKFWLLMV